VKATINSSEMPDFVLLLFPLYFLLSYNYHHFYCPKRVVAQRLQIWY